MPWLHNDLGNTMWLIKGDQRKKIFFLKQLMYLSWGTSIISEPLRAEGLFIKYVCNSSWAQQEIQRKRP